MAKIKEALVEQAIDDRLADERGPTLERVKQAWGQVDISTTGLITFRQSFIERAMRKGFINGRQKNAGDKLYYHWYNAGLAKLGLNWDFMPSGGRADPNHHREQVNAALTLVKMKIDEAGMNGGQAVTILQNVVCLDMSLEDAGRLAGSKGKHKAAHKGLTFLRAGLNILAKKWGIDKS